VFKFFIDNRNIWCYNKENVFFTVPEMLVTHAKDYNTASILQVKVEGNIIDGSWEYVSFEEPEDTLSSELILLEKR